MCQESSVKSQESRIGATLKRCTSLKVGVKCPPGATVDSDMYLCLASPEGRGQWVRQSNFLPTKLECIQAEKWCPLPEIQGAAIISLTAGEKFNSKLILECYGNFVSFQGYRGLVCGASRFWVRPHLRMAVNVVDNSEVLKCHRDASKPVIAPRFYHSVAPKRTLNRDTVSRADLAGA